MPTLGLNICLLVSCHGRREAWACLRVEEHNQRLECLTYAILRASAEIGAQFLSGAYSRLRSQPATVWHCVPRIYFGSRDAELP
jgi:hypothetical protein